MLHKSGNFKTTHWSIVVAAGGEANAQSRSAMEALCAAYWYPIYAYVRQRGQDVDEATDLTQEFFAHFLAKNYFSDITPERGRFRSYLLASVSHFLANEWDRRRTLKRGGGKEVLSFELEHAEDRYKLERAVHLTPERIYERRWACDVLDRVLAKVRAEFQRSDKAALFEAIKFTLTGEGSTENYSSIAASMGVSESMVKSAVHRIRQRYRELLKEEIAETVCSEDEIEDEIRCLFNALAQT